jgi:hypothetical protein
VEKSAATVRDSANEGGLESRSGSVRSPKYFEGPASLTDDVCLRHRYFTYATNAGIVAGADFSVMFTVDRPPNLVWPYFKDFTRWQKSFNHYYSGVVGDLYSRQDAGLGDEQFYISQQPNGEPGANRYCVLRVIPERLIVLFQPVSEAGGISGGFHTFMLNEVDDKTVITAVLNHATQSVNLSEEEALSPHRKITADVHHKWRAFFIPTLKKLVHENG